nr:hypothetical protein Iba_chr10aCG13930 [Ipomoea batatas]
MHGWGRNARKDHSFLGYSYSVLSPHGPMYCSNSREGASNQSWNSKCAKVTKSLAKTKPKPWTYPPSPGKRPVLWPKPWILSSFADVAQNSAVFDDVSTSAAFSCMLQLTFTYNGGHKQEDSVSENSHNWRMMNGDGPNREWNLIVPDELNDPDIFSVEEASVAYTFRQLSPIITDTVGGVAVKRLTIVQSFR